MDAKGLCITSAFTQVTEWQRMAASTPLDRELRPKDKIPSLDVTFRPSRAESVHCGGRGTRTHKPLRATVFKTVVVDSETFAQVS